MFRRRRQRVYALRGQSAHGIGQQEAFDEATKVRLLVMKSVRVEPCYAQSYQAGPQRDPVGSNQFEQVVNRRERIAGTDRNKGMVAFKDIQVWLGYLNQGPGQVRLLYVLHCDHPGLGVSFWRQVGADSIV
jgi:hypothetical protein